MNKRLALLVLSAACLAAFAQSAPPAAAPLVIVIGSPAGTPGDVVARAISDPLAAELGQPVVVENRPGAIGTVALAAVARARPDGQLVGIFGLPAAVAPSLLDNLPYDSLRDLAPVRQLSASSNMLVVRADAPYADLPALLAAARKERLTFASGGNGTPAHLAGELFAQKLQLQLQHVPYNGAVAGVTGVAGGHVEMMFATTPSVVALVKAGRLRAVASTGDRRTAALPDVPTLAEMGHAGLTVRDWHGMVAPAGTPPATLQRLSAALGRVLALDAVQQRMAGAGLEPVAASGPAEFRALLASEMARWNGVVRTPRSKEQ